MKFKSKAVTIDAQKIVSVGTTETDRVEPREFNLALDNGTNFTLPIKQCGNHTPNAGDYVIFGENDDTYLCPADVFARKYEPVDGEGTESGTEPKAEAA